MEPLVTIAIPDLIALSFLASTLASPVRHTPEPYEVVVLADASKAKSSAVQHIGIPVKQIIVSAPFSTPVALNRLLAACTMPSILHLESGTTVTAGWLRKLLASFHDPQVGLSGPSTNSSWNEQKILTGYEGTGWSVQRIDAYAAEVTRRYSNQQRPLDTLHSLGDFCYLFKRSVVEQPGGFDESYGTGPCWEIDFNTRAARAGFRAIWVVDAYVHRGQNLSGKWPLYTNIL